MVDDNLFGNDFFGDDFFDDDNESFDDFIKSMNEEEGLEKASEFEDIMKKIVDSEEGLANGKLISSTTIEKGNETYIQEVWEIDGMTITKITLNIKKSEKEVEKEEQEKYVMYLKETLKDLQEELKHAVSKEDYVRAAELKKRIQSIQEFLNNKSNN